MGAAAVCGAAATGKAAVNFEVLISGTACCVSIEALSPSATVVSGPSAAGFGSAWDSVSTAGFDSAGRSVETESSSIAAICLSEDFWTCATEFVRTVGVTGSTSEKGSTDSTPCSVTVGKVDLCRSLFASVV